MPDVALVLVRLVDLEVLEFIAFGFAKDVVELANQRDRMNCARASLINAGFGRYALLDQNGEEIEL